MKTAFDHETWCLYRKMSEHIREIAGWHRMSYYELRRVWSNLEPCTCDITRRIRD